MSTVLYDPLEDLNAAQPAAFLMQPNIDHFQWSYPMLPAWSAQRREYETLTPKHWKHQQLPGWIAELEARLEAITAEEQEAAQKILKAKEDLAKAERATGLTRREAVKVAEDAIGHWQSVVSGLERECRAVQADIAAHRQRYRQGIEMFGFEDEMGGQCS